MIQPGYDWNQSVPHGGTTYSLTFTSPGVNVYFDVSVSGMRGIVIVNPAGTPYPFTQEQYDHQAQDQLRSDIGAGLRASATDFEHVTTTTNSDGTQTHYVSLGSSPPEVAVAFLGPTADSAVTGKASLVGPGLGSSRTPTVTVSVELSGLAPGSVHSVELLLGVCGEVAPTTGLIFSQIFVPPTFVLSSVTAGPDGRGVSTTVITEPPNINGPGQLRLPSAGWFVNVDAGSAPSGGSSSVACGNVLFHSASVMRFLPQNIRVRVGDTVVWTDDTSNEVHSVVFLAGEPPPLIPDFFFAPPTGNATSYDGTTFFSSGPLYGADASLGHSFALTFTKPGVFPYVNAAYSSLGMQGRVIVTG